MQSLATNAPHAHRAAAVPRATRSSRIGGGAPARSTQRLSAQRRDLLAGTSLMLVGGCQLLPVSAEEEAAADVASTSAAAVAAPAPASLGGKRQVFIDVNIEGQGNVGRIVIALADDTRVGSQRFADLAEGKEGVGYRLSKWDGIFPSYIRNEGVKALSYSAGGQSAIAGGDSVAALEDELTASSRTHDQAGLVSLVVREATERPIKERLVAMKGKLVTLKEQAGEAPNGSGFMITTGPAPELDKTNLIVGQVVEGFDVVQKLSTLPFAKPRDSWHDAPFFAAGKAMGDKRAVMAEKRFNRPLKRVLVANAGLVS